LQLHLKCDQFEEGRPLKPWLYMIATNKAIDLKRRQGRLRLVSIHGSEYNHDADQGRLADVLASSQPSPEQRLEKSEQSARARRALNELPEHLRLVVELVYFQGLKYREAAEVLSIPVGTVKSRINAAISKLTASWEEFMSPSE
jgi:RNA polymerase sigma-70 factor (ECF subfamily)